LPLRLIGDPRHPDAEEESAAVPGGNGAHLFLDREFAALFPPASHFSVACPQYFARWIKSWVCPVSIAARLRNRRNLVRPILAVMAVLLLGACTSTPFGLAPDTRHIAQNCPASASSYSGGPATPYSCLSGGRETRS
jgi:hypothetical protein